MEPETKEKEVKAICANCEHNLTPTCIRCHKNDGFQPGDEWLCHDCCGEFYDPCPLAQEVIHDLEDDGRLVELRLAAKLPGNESFADMIEQFDAGSRKYAVTSWYVEEVMSIRNLSWAEAKIWLEEYEESIINAMNEAGRCAIRDL